MEGVHRENALSAPPFAVILAAVSSYSLLQSLVEPVLPTLQQPLHTSEDTVTWVLTAYLLTAAVATPIRGRVGDMVGKKKVLVATLACLALGSWSARWPRRSA